MANNISARIYKNKKAALKHAKKTGGRVIKDIRPVIHSHGKHALILDQIRYIVYSGNYRPL